MCKVRAVVVLGFLNILLKTEAAMTTDDSDGIYFGAIVMFNYTDLTTGNPMLVGSSSSNDEVGFYGFHSPIEDATGNVVYAFDPSVDRRDGCVYDYSVNNLTSPWIALMSRGGCTFSDKINNLTTTECFITQAYKYNATGVLIYDFADKDVTLMSHEGSQQVVSVMVDYELGTSVASLLTGGSAVVASIYPGEKHKTTQGSELGKTSIIFVCVSFMILMLVSLAWLVFYYIQRFRMVRALNRGERHRNNETRKALSKLPTKALKSNDELVACDNVCAICIDSFKANDCVRTLNCKHSFHKKCVDPWLQCKQTCPMCKVNFLKEIETEGHRNEIEMDETSFRPDPELLLQNTEETGTNSSSENEVSGPPLIAVTEIKL